MQEDHQFEVKLVYEVGSHLKTKKSKATVQYLGCYPALWELKKPKRDAHGPTPVVCPNYRRPKRLIFRGESLSYHWLALEIGA